MTETKKTEPVAIETVEAELMPLEQEDGLTKSHNPEVVLKNTKFLADHIDELVDARIKIWRAVLRIAKPGDWVIMDGKGCLSFAGAGRILSVIGGISLTNWTSEKITETDEYGTYYIWWYSADVHYQGRVSRVSGRCSSRNKLLGYKDKAWRELKDIDETNIRIIAERAVTKEAVNLCYGIKAIPESELRDAKVPLEGTLRYDHKGGTPPQTPVLTGPVGEEKVPEAETVQSLIIKITQILSTICKTPEEAELLTETLTGFVGKDGTVVKGKKRLEDLSEGRLKVLLGKVRAKASGKDVK